ncbi:Glycoside hydrolase [Globisporangium polare]
MKVKTISRVEKDFTQEVNTDKLKVFRNYDPALHPFERPREYTRALNAVKLERMFAKPFIGALDGHSDGVSSIATSPNSLVAFLSGAADGEIRVWDLPRRKCVWSCYGHKGFVRGLTVAPGGKTFFSCSEDKTVKQWSLHIKDDEDEVPTALSTFASKEPFLGIDHHWTKNLFATCSSKVQVWDHQRSEPTHEFSWGADSITAVKFNPAEASLLASTGSDRTVTLYDIRVASSMRKIVMEMRSNALAWNPMEPFNFTVANEDHNLYTFDMRRMKRALMVHKDHVSAVMDVAYSPTGKEFVSGSYDRTIRIFNIQSAKSREVYHTKRMQRIFSVKFSADANFVLSGSDDTNIRIWKSEASKSLAKAAPRERRKLEYQESLKERYQHLREINRISKFRHVPRAIKKAADAKREASSREKHKMENKRAHAKPGAIPHVNTREHAIVRELE